MALRVLYDFAAEEEGELSVRTGDMVTLVDDSNAEKDGWVLVELVAGGGSGFIPAEYAVPTAAFAQPAAPAPAPAQPRVEAPATPAAAVAGPARAEPQPQPPQPPQEDSLMASLRSLTDAARATAAATAAAAAAASPSVGGAEPHARTRFSFSAAAPATDAAGAWGGATGSSSAGGGGGLGLSAGQGSGSARQLSPEEMQRYFAAHEEWYRSATLKRQETYRGLQGDCVEVLRQLAEAEGRSSGLLSRIGELEALIADERSRWTQKMAEDAQ